jgi:hypothetical protein
LLADRTICKKGENHGEKEGNSHKEKGNPRKEKGNGYYNVCKADEKTGS